MGEGLTFGEMIKTLKLHGLKNDSIIEHYEIKVKKTVGSSVCLYPVDIQDIWDETKRILGVEESLFLPPKNGGEEGYYVSKLRP